MDMAFKVKGLILKDYAVASAKPKRDLPWSDSGIVAHTSMRT